MTFRPTFWPTVIALPMLAVLVGLGIWQVERLQWKESLIRELTLRGSGPAIPLPTDDSIPVADLMYRPVTVAGRYMDEAEMHLLNRVRKGVPGMHLVTPLERSDGGPTILVDRGWVPLDWSGTPAGGPADVTVTGIVRTPPEPSVFIPDNRPEKNEWYYLDPVAMAQNAGVLPFSDYYVYATAEAPAKLPTADGSAASEPDYPVPNEWKVDLPNNHLSYAITWFALAGILAAIYLIYHSNQRPTS